MVLFRVLYTGPKNADSSVVTMVFMKRCVCVWWGRGGQEQDALIFDVFTC